MFRNYQKTATDLIYCGHGIIEDDIYITKPGILLISDMGVITNDAKNLFKTLHINMEQNVKNILAQFSALMTYLSFPSKSEHLEQHSNNIHNKLKQRGHTSPYEIAEKEIIILIAGVSIETMFEIACHSRFKVARICSSRTSSMNQPLYRLPGNNYMQQAIKNLIQAQNSIYEKWSNNIDECKTDLSSMDLKELKNMGHIGYKAGYIVIGTSLHDLEQVLIGRLEKNGVENEVRNIFERVCQLVHDIHPEIKTIHEYYSINPNKKI